MSETTQRFVLLPGENGFAIATEPAPARAPGPDEVVV